MVLSIQLPRPGPSDPDLRSRLHLERDLILSGSWRQISWRASLLDTLITITLLTHALQGQAESEKVRETSSLVSSAEDLINWWTGQSFSIDLLWDFCQSGQEDCDPEYRRPFDLSRGVFHQDNFRKRRSLDKTVAGDIVLRTQHPNHQVVASMSDVPFR